MRNWLFGALFTVQVLMIVAMVYYPTRLLVLYILVVVGLLLLLLLFRSVLLPARTVRYGLDLIAAQDFNNRLVKVGEREADKIVTLFNTMIDKLRNERLQNMERENFLQLLVEASPMGVVMLDFDGRISLVNPSFLRMTGLNTEMIVTGRRVDDLPSGLAKRMGAVPLGVSELIRLGDIRRYRCYHLNFIQSGFSRQFFLLESLTDEVMKAERSAYEKVIRIISHEVNNTMGGVRSVLDTLHDVLEGDDIREVIESCDNRCDKMTRFISSYADVVRVPDAVKSPVSLNAVVGEMIPFLQGMLSEGMTLEYNPDSKTVEADIDVSLMQQVIVNIVKNAKESFSRDYAVTLPHIEITTGHRHGRPMLEISNNGKPLSDEVSAQLFSPFFTTKREGRGIGLTLISEILNRHNASYSLHTDSDGITRFIILL